MNAIKETYRGVEITYREEANQWLANGYRNKESLKAMREAIDRQLDKPEAKKSQRTEAIRKDISRPEIVTITSVCENGDVWFSKNGHREKDWGGSARFNYFILDDQSSAIVKQWDALQQQIENLKEQQGVLVSRLKPLDLTKLA